MATDEEKIKDLTEQLARELRSSSGINKEQADEGLIADNNPKNKKEDRKHKDVRRVSGMPKMKRSNENLSERKVLYIKVILLSIFLYLVFFMINDDSRKEKYKGGIERLYGEMSKEESGIDASKKRLQKEIFNEKYTEESTIDIEKKSVKKQSELYIDESDEGEDVKKAKDKKVYIKEEERTDMVKEAEKLLGKNTGIMGDN